MFLRTKSWQISRTLADGIADAICATAPADPLLDSTHLVLYTAGPIPSFDPVKADFTLATFAGYAAVALAPTLGPVNFPTNRRGYHQECEFTAGVILAPQTILGCLVLDAAGTGVLAQEQFEAPYTFSVNGDTLSYDAIFAPATLLPGEYDL